MDSLGHLDYIVRYAPTDYKYQPEQFREILEAILQTLIQKDLALEINTSGFKTPLSRQNPHEKIIEWYLALGGEMVTIVQMLILLNFGSFILMKWQSY